PMVLYSADIKNLVVQMYCDSKNLQYINKTLQCQIFLHSLMQWMANYRQYKSVVWDPETYQQQGCPHIFESVTLNLLTDLIKQSPLIYLNKLQ
ncbi:hypothetical protein CROQUDRAFT_16059, partial [Cronartium quercuum f. sp. fusiforme G11]